MQFKDIKESDIYSTVVRIPSIDITLHGDGTIIFQRLQCHRPPYQYRGFEISMTRKGGCLLYLTQPELHYDFIIENIKYSSTVSLFVL
jgi:hypothetical protein